MCAKRPEDQFLDYIEGRLPADEAERFEERLDSDGGLRRSFTAYKELMALERDLHAVQGALQPAFDAKVMRAVEQAEEGVLQRWQRWWEGHRRLLIASGAAFATVVIALRVGMEAPEKASFVLPAAVRDEAPAAPARSETDQDAAPEEEAAEIVVEEQTNRALPPPAAPSAAWVTEYSRRAEDGKHAKAEAPQLAELASARRLPRDTHKSRKAYKEKSAPSAPAAAAPQARPLKGAERSAAAGWSAEAHKEYRYLEEAETAGGYGGREGSAAEKAPRQEAPILGQNAALDSMLMRERKSGAVRAEEPSARVLVTVVVRAKGVPPSLRPGSRITLAARSAAGRGRRGTIEIIAADGELASSDAASGMVTVRVSQEEARRIQQAERSGEIEVMPASR